MSPTFVTVSADADVQENVLTRVDVAGNPVVLTRVGGKLCALGGLCTHEAAELVDGDLEDGVLWCPLHASGFDVHTGAVTSAPADKPLPVYAVRVVDGRVQVSTTPVQNA